MPPALETAAARVPLEVPSIGALMMMGCWACGNQVISLDVILKLARLVSNAEKTCLMMLSMSSEVYGWGWMCK